MLGLAGLQFRLAFASGLGTAGRGKKLVVKFSCCQKDCKELFLSWCFWSTRANISLCISCLVEIIGHNYWSPRKAIVYVCIWYGFKVFRYSFFGTIPSFLNRLLDSRLLVKSTWNLQYLLVLDWTLAWFTFCKNRYFHDNDKQKSSKTVKLKFCTIQISLRKANTSILNCGVWQTKYTRTKKFCMFVLK